MQNYHFFLERSGKAEEQVPGITCHEAKAEGEVEAASLGDAFRFAYSLCFLPGTWNVYVVRGGGKFKRWFRRHVVERKDLTVAAQEKKS